MTGHPDGTACFEEPRITSIHRSHFHRALPDFAKACRSLSAHVGSALRSRISSRTSKLARKEPQLIQTQCTQPPFLSHQILRISRPTTDICWNRNPSKWLQQVITQIQWKQRRSPSLCSSKLAYRSKTLQRWRLVSYTLTYEA